MRTSTHSGPFLLAVTVPVLGAFLIAPIVGSGAAKKITEDIYVTDSANKRVYVLETIWKGKKAAKTNLVDTITDFKNPTEVAVGGGVALVVDDKVVQAIDAATRMPLGKLKTGKNTRFVTVTNDGKFGLATQGKRFLKVIDMAKAKIVAKIKTGKTPSRVRIDDNGEFGAVVNLGDNSITIFDLPTVLARQAASIDGTSSRAAAGVRTLKVGVCQLSGGLDVAAFGGFGTWAIWSCGGAPVAAAQQANISDESAVPLEYAIANRTMSNFVAWNPDCPTKFGEDGLVGSADVVARASGSGAGQSSFRYDWTTEKTEVLGPGRMVNHFGLVDGGRLSLYHPKGVGRAKVAVWDAPDDGEIFSVASTLTGVPVVCHR